MAGQFYLRRIEPVGRMGPMGRMGKTRRYVGRTFRSGVLFQPDATLPGEESGERS
jgi:hypothetical protein